jgi:hypothetical protein
LADEKHIERLKQGVEAWNTWRREEELRGADLRYANLDGANQSYANLVAANLSGANLSDAILDVANLRDADLPGADLSGANLVDADLSAANLVSAKLVGANLIAANLNGANLAHSKLHRADLFRANLSSADLSSADLYRVDLSEANLNGANLTEAVLAETIFADLDLSSTIGLETCQHLWPSIIDHRTLQKSGPLPIPFLRGVGLSENLIDYLPALFNQAIQYTPVSLAIRVRTRPSLIASTPIYRIKGYAVGSRRMTCRLVGKYLTRSMPLSSSAKNCC